MNRHETEHGEKRSIGSDNRFVVVVVDGESFYKIECVVVDGEFIHSTTPRTGEDK